MDQLKVDNKTLKALITPDGGELIDMGEDERRAVSVNGQVCVSFPACDSSCCDILAPAQLTAMRCESLQF